MAMASPSPPRAPLLGYLVTRVERTPLFLWTLTYLVSSANAIGEPCQTANSKLDPNSHKFRSDCGPKDYCSPITLSSASPASNNATAGSSVSRQRSNGQSDNWAKGKQGSPSPGNTGGASEDIASSNLSSPPKKDDGDSSSAKDAAKSSKSASDGDADGTDNSKDEKDEKDENSDVDQGESQGRTEEEGDEDDEDGSDGSDTRIRRRQISAKSYLEPVFLLGYEMHLSKRSALSNVFLASAPQQPILAINSSTSPPSSSNGTIANQNIHAPIVGESETSNGATGGNGTGVCRLKGCRRDEFPFGYAPEDALPPRCPLGQFCPDEEDYCRTLLPLGSTCQLNRDDQCSPAPNSTLFSSESNFNGSICLSFTCMYADRQAGQTCIIDNTVYSGLLPDNSTFTDIISRHNCAPGLYCSSEGLVCTPTFPVGQPCKADMQCLSGNCDNSNICVSPPETPAPVPRAVVVLVPLLVIAGLAGMIFSLYTFHQRARRKRSETLHEYWTEQLAYRRTLINMHLAAQQEERRELLGQGARTNSYAGSDYSDARNKGLPREPVARQRQR